jgi:hypothetical protein
MSFPEKSAITMIGVLVAVYGGYALVILRWLAVEPAEEIAYQPLMVVAVIPLTVLAAGSHIILAVLDPRGANEYDERDRLITLRSERVACYVLAVAMFCGVTLTMVEVPHFWIAHTLMLLWVLAEIVEGISKVVLYRRGT